MKDRPIIWDEQVPFPAVREMPLPDRITHLVIERARDNGYRYLHEPAHAFHRGVLHVCWANCREREMNVEQELCRGRRSADGGLTWSEPFVVAPGGGEERAHNQPVMVSHNDRLWAFITRHDNKLITGMEAFCLDDASGEWRSRGLVTRGFAPFDAPQRLRNGTWIIGGETQFDDADPAVAFCDDDSFSSWRVIRIPVSVPHDLRCPETTVLVHGDGALTAISRYEERGTPFGTYPQTSPHCLWALASVSHDHGCTWSPTLPSNLPMWPSKPFAGRLSTGQPYLVFNAYDVDNPTHRRNHLVIAVGRPGADVFSAVWQVRQGTVGTAWAYPYAVEHEGVLWISYSINKRDCGLSILPVSALAFQG